MKSSICCFGRRVLAVLLCLCLLLPGVLVRAEQESVEASRTYRLIAGSDFQYSNSDHGIAGGQVRDMMNRIKSEGVDTIDGFLFCGDYSQAFTSAATKEGLAYLQGVVTEVYPDLSDDRKVWCQGNHDPDELTTDGTLSTSGAHDTEGYGVFLIHEKDYTWYSGMNEPAIRAAASNLRAYLNAKLREKYTKPIFIMSHLQLHYSMRTHDNGDGMYGNYLFDVINEAAGKGLNIIFMFGHNHSNGWDDYLGGANVFLTKGDPINVAQASQTVFQREILNFSYMNAGYVGYYTRVNDGAENSLTMSLFEITDDQVTISRYTKDGLQTLKAVGVTNAYKNETAYGADTRVYDSPQVVALNRDFDSTAISGVTVSGLTSYQAVAAAAQAPQGYDYYQSYHIRSDEYVDGTNVSIQLPLESGIDVTRPAVIIDHQRAKTYPISTANGTAAIIANHLGTFTVAQSAVAGVSATGKVDPYFRTVAQGETPVEGVPYVVTDSNITGTSHWVLTGDALQKSVGGTDHTGLALIEVADPATAPVWYYSGGYLRFGSTTGQYLNVSYTGTYNGDSSVGLVTVGDYNAATTASVGRFGTGPSYYMGTGGADTPVYLAHRNTGADSIASVYAKYNYNVSLWYLNEVVSQVQLTVAPSQNVVTTKNTVWMMPTVTAGSKTLTDYTIVWSSGDESIATVSTGGMVTPLKPGQVYIRANLITAEGKDVNVSVEIPITVTSLSKNGSTTSNWTQYLQRKGTQVVPEAGNAYIVGFYSGGWILTSNILHKGDPGYNGLNGVEGLEVAPHPGLGDSAWYYDGTNLFAGTQADSNKYLIYQDSMVTVGPITGNAQAFQVDKSVYEYWPYLTVFAGKLNHYGGAAYNVASLYNGNNFMCFYQLINDQKICLDVTADKDVLYPQDTVSLSAAVRVDDAAVSDYAVAWTSSDIFVAEVDGNGVVTAKNGGSAVITATLTSANGTGLSEVLSVDIPIQVVSITEDANSITGRMVLDRMMLRTTELVSGTPYVVGSCLVPDWTMTSRQQVSPYNGAYTGMKLEHFDLAGYDALWYYTELTVEGVTKQYLNTGSPGTTDQYLICDNRVALLGELNATPFEAITAVEGTEAFMISTAAGRNLHQIGGAAHDTAIPTSQYVTATGSKWTFNTVVPERTVELSLSKSASPVHSGSSLSELIRLNMFGAELTDYQVQWSCSDAATATISEDVLTVLSTGSVVLTASVTKVNDTALEVPLTLSVPVTVEAHDWVDATCETPKACSICGLTEGEAPGHSYTTVTVDAACETDGSITDTCTVCGDVQTQLLPATGHTEEVLSGYDATCTEDGLTDGTYCIICGETIIEQQTIPSTGHTEEVISGYDATCTEDGLTDGTYCIICGETIIEQQTIPATGHTEEVLSGYDATCTEDGLTDGTYCIICGETIIEQQTIPSTGHTEEVISGYDATCTEDGLTDGSYCTTCGETITVQEIIYATGHTEETLPGYDATCTEDGLTDGSYCTVCGETVIAQEIISATGHYEDALYGYDATCTEDGLTDGTYCIICGETVTTQEIIPATGHSFVDGFCTVCGEADPDYVAPVVQPTLSLKFPTLTFEDVITMNVFFQAENLGDVVEMGLITYKSQVSQWNVDNAEAVVPGYIWNETEQLYAASTLGIPAKEMGDTYWFAVYAKLSDGSYTYTGLVSYSPTTYAYNQLGDPNMSPLVVAMLNYGAAAQVYFDYRTDSLMNAGLTQEQQASIEGYRVDMMDGISTVTAEKSANFTRTATGFAKRYPTITFEGAFSIDYLCQPSAVPVGDITLYYWDQTAFDSADVLSADNATGILTLEQKDGMYATAVKGIAAKDLDKGVYVAFVYTDGTNTYCSGILGYSIGVYCTGLAAGTDAMAPFAAATAVYGYYAKQTFN